MTHEGSWGGFRTNTQPSMSCWYFCGPVKSCSWKIRSMLLTSPRPTLIGLGVVYTPNGVLPCGLAAVVMLLLWRVPVQASCARRERVLVSHGGGAGITVIV